MVIVFCLGTIGWLLVTHQAFTLDGLFIIAVCKLTALAFALYLWFMVNRAKEELAKESKAAAKGK